MDQDIRWKQRFDNYKKALQNLSDAIELSKSRNLSKLEEQGLIKGFELVHELSWLMIKDYFNYKGETNIYGSRDAFRLAFKQGLIQNGETFMRSIKTRQLSVHTYSEEKAEQIHYEVLNIYHTEFLKLKETFDKLSDI